MCNACYIFFMCAPSHMCMQIHIQKCPVTLIVSPVPRVVCKEMDAYPSCSHASHDYSFVCECAFTYGIRFRFSKLLMWVLPAAVAVKGQECSGGCFIKETLHPKVKSTWPIVEPGFSKCAPVALSGIFVAQVRIHYYYNFIYLHIFYSSTVLSGLRSQK